MRVTAVRRSSLLAALCCVLGQAHDWIIVPGERVGPITPETTYSALQLQFGSENVHLQPVDVGEGIEEPGAIIYPGDASKTLAVVWRDSGASAKPPSVMVCYGQREEGKCDWKTREGISLGTPLLRLEALNRRPFRLAGFGWDYSGTVMSWSGGWLETILNHKGRLIVRLLPQSLSGPEYAQLMGDREFSSSHPAMQKLNPRVYGLTVTFTNGNPQQP